MACSAPPATRGAGGTESWSRDLDQARRGVGRVGARCARGRHRWRAGWLAADDGGVATRSRRAPLSEGGPSSRRRCGARCARRRPDHRAPFAREGPPSGKRPRRGSRDDGRGKPSTQRHRSQAPRRGGRLGARCWTSRSSSCTCSPGTSRRFGCTRTSGSSARAFAGAITSATASSWTRCSWPITSPRHGNPFHLERPDQEATHLGLVTRVEQGVSSDHPAGVADCLDELCDRGAGLGPTDRERDPARHGSERRHVRGPAPDRGLCSRDVSLQSRRRWGGRRPCRQPAGECVPCLCRLCAGCVTQQVRSDERDELVPCGRAVPPQRLGVGQPLGGSSGSRREERRVRHDRHARKVQTVGVPARADRRVCRDLSFRVQPERLVEIGERLVAEAQHPLLAKAAERTRLPAARARGQPLRSHAVCRGAARSRTPGGGRRARPPKPARAPSP